ncbi:MAG: secondary thiamine-phosphate synthase enzyme YjbQ [Patescibacteria group bacterium]|nr:secondary thiamine-phosphate synthase enzyme YjbQ [Patescibacteria group bacterium]
MAKYKELKLSTKGQFGLVNISSEVDEFVRNSGIEEGVCYIFVPHATAALIANENESGVKEDILTRILALAPDNIKYKHDQIDNNARAHIMASILGPEIFFPITQAMLVRGTWQDIFLVELDGPRSERRVILKIIEG